MSLGLVQPGRVCAEERQKASKSLIELLGRVAAWKAMPQVEARAAGALLTALVDASAAAPPAAMPLLTEVVYAIKDMVPVEGVIIRQRLPGVKAVVGDVRMTGAAARALLRRVLERAQEAAAEAVPRGTEVPGVYSTFVEGMQESAVRRVDETLEVAPHATAAEDLRSIKDAIATNAARARFYAVSSLLKELPKKLAAAMEGPGGLGELRRGTKTTGTLTKTQQAYAAVLSEATAAVGTAELLLQQMGTLLAQDRTAFLGPTAGAIMNIAAANLTATSALEGAVDIVKECGAEVLAALDRYPSANGACCRKLASIANALAVNPHSVEGVMKPLGGADAEFTRVRCWEVQLLGDDAPALPHLTDLVEENTPRCGPLLAPAAIALKAPGGADSWPDTPLLGDKVGAAFAPASRSRSQEWGSDDGSSAAGVMAAQAAAALEVGVQASGQEEGGEEEEEEEEEEAEGGAVANVNGDGQEESNDESFSEEEEDEEAVMRLAFLRAMQENAVIFTTEMAAPPEARNKAAVDDALRALLGPWRAYRKSVSALVQEAGKSPALLVAASSFEAPLSADASYELMKLLWGDEGQHGGASGYEAFRSPEGLYDALGLTLAVGYVRLGRRSAGATCPVPAPAVAALLASLPRMMPAGGEAEQLVAAYRGYLGRLALQDPTTTGFFLARPDAAIAPLGGVAPPNGRTGGLLGMAECVAAAGNLALVQGQWWAGWQLEDLAAAYAQVQAVGVDEGALQALVNGLAHQAEQTVIDPGNTADATAAGNARRTALHAVCVAAQAREASQLKPQLSAVNAQLVEQAQVSAALQASAIDAWAALSAQSQRLQQGQNEEAFASGAAVGQRGAGQLRWYHRFAWERISVMAGNRNRTAALETEGAPPVSCVVEEVVEGDEEEALMVVEGAVLVLVPVAPQPHVVGTAAPAEAAAAPLLPVVAAVESAQESTVLSSGTEGEVAAAVEAAVVVAAVSEQSASEAEGMGLVEVAASVEGSKRSNGKHKRRLVRFGLAVASAVAGAVFCGARRAR